MKRMYAPSSMVRYVPKRKYGAKKTFRPRFPMSRIPMQVPMGSRYTSSRREIKFCDIPITVTNARVFSTPPTAIVLNVPVQGAAPYNRIGSKVMNKSLRIRGIVNNQTTLAEDALRIIVVYDRQTNGAAPAWADVIQATASGGGTSNNLFDGVNMSNRERFKVLIDEQILTPAVTDPGGAGSITLSAVYDTSGKTNKFNFDRFVKLHGLETHYKATAGAVGDIATGGLFLFVVEYAGDQAWAFNWTARLRFDDL